MSNQASDQKLVERVQKGDKGAFDLLVLKYQHKIVNLIMRYVRDPELAQDIAQEAFTLQEKTCFSTFFNKFSKLCQKQVHCTYARTEVKKTIYNLCKYKHATK